MVLSLFWMFSETIKKYYLMVQPELVLTIQRLGQIDGVELIITTGGTGLGPRDLTIQTIGKNIRFKIARD